MKNNSNYNFNCFLYSNIISKFGDSVDLIAFMWLTFRVTDSLLLTGIVTAFNGLPAILFGLFSGIIADRFNKKNLMLIGDLARGLIVTCVCLLYITNYLNVIILIIATLLISSFEILSTPARRSVLPIIVVRQDLLKCNSKLSSCKLMAQLLGLSLAGVIIGKYGIIIAVSIDAITFFLSFILILGMKFDDESRKKNIKLGTLKKEISEAFSVLINEKIVLKTTILATIVNLFIGSFNLLLMNYCMQVFKNDSNGQSILNTVNIIGILLVSFYFIKITDRIKVEHVIDIGFVILGLSFILFGINTKFMFALIITLLYGVGTGFITITSVTLIQRDTPVQHLGKIMSIISLINESSIPLGNLFTGLLIKKIQINKIFMIYGIVMILCAISIAILFKMKDKILFDNKL